MLEDCLIESRSSGRSRKPLTLVVSVITHGSLIAVLVLIPLFQKQLLPHTTTFEPLRPPEVRTQVTPLVPTAHQAASAVPTPVSTDLFAPLVIPEKIAIIVDAPIPGTEGFQVSGPGGRTGTVGIGDLIGDFGARVATPPPVPPPTPPPAPPKAPEPAPVPTEPVRRSSTLVMSNLIHQVQPIYPVLAVKSHTEGNVTLEAVITKQGTIDPARIRVMQGNILLNQAAIDAVVQWRYRPTILSGEAVEVLATISINFTLAR